jgi:hypothetical protein
MRSSNTVLKVFIYCQAVRAVVSYGNESDDGNSMSRRRNAGEELIHHRHTPVRCHSNRTASTILEKNMGQ